MSRGFLQTKHSFTRKGSVASHGRSNILRSTAHFDTEAYAELITRADELFTEQVKRYAAHGTEDYVRIITEVRSLWTNSPHEYSPICDNHEVAGNNWLELEIAERVGEQLLDLDLVTSRAARKFLVAFKVMVQ
jgi:hypothetical protein